MIRIFIAIFAFLVYFNDPSLKPLFIPAMALTIYEYDWDIYKGAPIVKERIITFFDRNGNIMIEFPFNTVKAIIYMEKVL